MSDSNHSLLLEFLSWVHNHPRTYDEAMEAWQSHCPRQTIWEDAIIEGLVEINRQPNDCEVVLTARGAAILNAKERDQKNLPSKLPA
ncbi:MAG: hypothetical protein ACXW6T_13330 [Candidatus Binatia bacterium]